MLFSRGIGRASAMARLWLALGVESHHLPIPRLMRALLLVVAVVGWGPVAQPLYAEEGSTRPTEGLRTSTTSVHAIIGARLVVQPGRSIENGTLIVRDGAIAAIGTNVPIPVEARRWQFDSHVTIYPGLIDAYHAVTTTPQRQGPLAWNPSVTPEVHVSDLGKLDEGEQEQWRNLGFTCRYLAPAGRIISGWGALVTTSPGSWHETLLVAEAAQHVHLTVAPAGDRQPYPASPMGAVALARQSFYDAAWYQDAWRVYATQPGLPRPEANHSLEALQRVVDQQRLVLAEATDEQYVLRADQFAREFGLRLALRGSGHEYRRLAAVQATGRTIIVPLDFPPPPAVATTEQANQVTLETLLHWDLAPENPGRLAQAGIPIALTTHGLKNKSDFWKQLRRAVKHGLSQEQALEALTLAPARLYGVESQVGSLELGKLANLTIIDGDLFDEKAKVLETWIAGKRHRIAPEKEGPLLGTWELTLASDTQPQQIWLSIEEKGDSYSGVVLLREPSAVITPAAPTPSPPTASVETSTTSPPGESTVTPPSVASPSVTAPSVTTPTPATPPPAQPTAIKQIKQSQSQLELSFDAQTIVQQTGLARLSGVLVRSSVSGTAQPLAPAAESGSAAEFFGTLVWPDGKSVTVRGNRHGPPYQAPATGAAPDGPSAATSPPPPVASASQPARSEVNYPLGAWGLAQAPAQPARLALRGATLWTCGPAGTISAGTLLIENGRITRVRDDATLADSFELPSDTVIIDVAGKHITPGLIDCHSHMATDGGINEGTQAVTAEVRIGDFIDATDVAIYQQLAGGVTTANILHGSANPIGGQSQVIKLRWGDLPEQLKFADAPAGIKFALGENVKQSNWGAEFRTRYPQTRMGVEQIIRDTFHAAQAYEERWRRWNRDHTGLPPRRDLELDAIVEVLNHARWIHCHSYRQDEILALLRTLELFHVRVGTLQHILEGYKISDILAAHGAMASSFADWWAYKFEVYDAIPYNGAMMHQAGIVVSFNSDDRELARHLNHEAAKAVKYGGVAPDEALKFVTANPARQLRIDQHVGTLEPGKHADFVIWSGPPLSTLSTCEATWIDGRKYFDRSEDRQRRVVVDQMRNSLIQKALTSDEKPAAAEETKPLLRQLWPREDVYCPHHHGERQQ